MLTCVCVCVMYLQPKLNVILVHVDLHDQQLLVYLLQVNSAGHHFIKTFQSTPSLYSFVLMSTHLHWVDSYSKLCNHIAFLGFSLPTSRSYAIAKGIITQWRYMILTNEIYMLTPWTKNSIRVTPWTTVSSTLLHIPIPRE